MGDGVSDLIGGAANRHGVFSMRGALERLFARVFRGLVYNQTWEDPRVDAEGLRLGPSSRLIVISSAGCNVLNYLAAGPESIVAVDINRCHMYLTRLKLAALAHLPTYEDFFRFFGCADSPGNVESYRRHVRDHLDEDARRYWDGASWPMRLLGRSRVSCFSDNFYRHGVLGRFLTFLQLCGRAAGVDGTRLVRARSVAEQRLVYESISEAVFGSPLFRAIARSPVFLFGIGIPPQQRETLVRECGGDVLELFRSRVRRLACTFPLGDNYFAWQAFSMGYDRDGRSALPDYLREGNYARIRQNAHRVETEIASVTERLRRSPEGSFDGVVLLDSQDWMTDGDIRELWREIARAGSPGARVLFRTASSESPVERALPAALRSRFTCERELSLDLHSRDRSAIYGGIHVYRLDEPVRGGPAEGPRGGHGEHRGRREGQTPVSEVPFNPLPSSVLPVSSGPAPAPGRKEDGGPRTEGGCAVAVFPPPFRVSGPASRAARAGSARAGPGDHAALMDRIYRFQRHFYDLTRPFILFGRDRLLDGMELEDGARVLEVGCGTARNLIALARRRPSLRLYGLDASREMLATAEAKLRRRGLAGRIEIRRCLAEDLDCRRTFGLDRPFDAVFLSYALTMMPSCVEALDAAVASLRPGGTLHVLDFWDQAGLPGPVRTALTRWLALFHVRHRPEVLARLGGLARKGAGELRVGGLPGRYSYVARFRCGA